MVKLYDNLVHLKPLLEAQKDDKDENEINNVQHLFNLYQGLIKKIYLKRK